MKTCESFESNRWIWRINIALQVLLVAAAVGLVNYIGMLVWFRHDLTRNRAFSLSAETKAEVANLPQGVTIVVTIPPEEPDELSDKAYRDVRGILREFEYAARGNKPGHRVDVEFVNIYLQTNRAEQLGVADLPNAVVFKSGGRRHVVVLADLYTVRDKQVRQFKGEKVFASAMLEVASNTRPVLYFLTGHGELQPDDFNPARGGSDLDAQLTARNFDTRTLNLAETRRVPEDAAMLLVLSPASAVLPAEEDALRDYMTRRSGRMLVTVEPRRPHGLDRLFEDWGILADDVEAIEQNPAYLYTGGDLLVRAFKLEHPITQMLAEFQQQVLFGRARSVRADPGRPIDDALEVSNLMGTSPDRSWGEAGYRLAGPPTFDPARDLRGPVVVGVTSERKVRGVSLRGGRLVVFGGGDFVTNNRLTKASNFTLLLNSVNWALDSGTKLDIPPRPVEQLELTMSQRQLWIARVSILFGPALAV
ncbi:MAG: GldG family protein, partial [Opitutaceae bacterium]|nr:GldG family protein [Opitutaceae bacterium]